MVYIKQLDALRAIAIFFVLCHHWLPKGDVLYKISAVISAPNIFFTISGFLITMILLKDRNKAETNGISKNQLFADFFLKRSLRILPAYYLTVIATYVLFPDYVPHLGKYLNFTINFKMYFTRDFGYLSHLWTMSVEQQFYLVWPFMMLCIPKRFLLHTITAFILAGIVSQHALPNSDFLWILPQTCFDALGIGAMLAWVIIERKDLFPRVYQVLRILGIVCVGLIIIREAFDFTLSNLNRTMGGIITAWLIAYFIKVGNGKEDRLSFIFQNKVLLLIGQMSYGIYLYHLTLYFHSRKPLQMVNELIPIPRYIKDDHYFFVLENLIILLVMAWLSWRFFELPINNLKSYLKKESTVPNRQKTI